MFVRNGAMSHWHPDRNASASSTFLVKGRPKSVQQLRDSTGGAQGAERHRTVIPNDTRMLFPPGVKVPPC